MDNRSVETSNILIINKQVNWSAIFAGVITAIMIGSFFNALGIALGLFAFNPETSDFTRFSGSTIFWLFISTVLYSFIGAFIAARFSAVVKRGAGMLNGFIAWSLATIFTLLVVSSGAGFMLNTAVKIVGNTFAATVQAVPKAAAESVQVLLPNKEKNLQTIKNQVDKLVGHSDAAAITKDYDVWIAAKEFLTANHDDVMEKQQLKERLILLLIKDGNMSEPQATQQVEQWEQTYESAKTQVKQKTEQVKQTAIDATNTASNALASMMLIMAFMTFVGGCASLLGGFWGIRRKE